MENANKEDIIVDYEHLEEEHNKTTHKKRQCFIGLIIIN